MKGEKNEKNNSNSSIFGFYKRISVDGKRTFGRTIA